MTAPRCEVIGDCTLWLGDARDVLGTLGPVDVLITDPPYGVGFHGKAAKQRGGGMLQHTEGYRSLEDTPAYVETVVLPIIRQALFLARRAAITPGVRHCFQYPPPADLGCFYSAAGTGMSRWGFMCSQPILFYGTCPFLERGKGSRANSHGQTWPNDANTTGHPCAKPMAQMAWLVGRASWEGECVLDPFAGVATIGVACITLGRRYVGIEIDEHYFTLACRRIEAAYRQPDLFVSRPRAVAPVQPGLFPRGAQKEAGRVER